MRCPCCDCDYERKEEKELAIYEGMDAKQFQAMELALSRMEKTDRSAALKSRKQAKEAVSAEQWFGAVVRFYQNKVRYWIKAGERFRSAPIATPTPKKGKGTPAAFASSAKKKGD